MAWYYWNGASWTAASADPRTITTVESPAGTYVTNTTYVVVDSSLAVFMLTGSGIIRNGTTDSRVTAASWLLYYNRIVYLYGTVTTTGWFYWNNGGWTSTAGDPRLTS